MLGTQGGRFGGWGFYGVKGEPVFTWNLLALTSAIEPGRDQRHSRRLALRSDERA